MQMPLRALPAAFRRCVVAQGRAALKYLASRPDANGKTGAVGFCWGGTAVNNIAVSASELSAGVVFYGGSPDLAKSLQIKARLLIQQASRDSRLVGMLPDYEKALKAAGIRYEAIVYPDVDHAFMNDTSAERYNAATAKQGLGAHRRLPQRTEQPSTA